jgi:hypothetical protein
MERRGIRRAAESKTAKIQANFGDAEEGDYSGRDASVPARDHERRAGVVESKAGIGVDRWRVAQADGSALRLRQYVDRRADLYVKQLSDPVTERVIQYVRKPLTEHRRHGEAKPQPYRPREARRH